MHILAVEDDQISLRLLGKKLKEWNYSLDLAQDGMEAWEKLESSSFDIIVTDWMMPRMDGIELCRRIRNTDFKRYIYLILLTAQDDEKEIVRGLEAGADDYLTKPINYDELRVRIEIGIRIIKLERDLTSKYEVIQENYFQTIRMFANLIETFNEDLGGHSRRVAELSLKLAKKCPNVSHEDLPVIEATGLLHDIGMIGLPTEIITKKTTEMNGDEKQLYLSHSVQGEIILKEIEFFKLISELVRTHHEQVNGRGFPDGLDGKKIPLLAKIVSAADTYDDLVFKWKIPLKDIPGHLHRKRGYQLEPFLIDHLLEINLENAQEDEENNFLEITIADLEEGMILAKCVRMKNGALAMPAETEISSHTIEKLKHYYKLARITNRVLIYKNI